MLHGCFTSVDQGDGSVAFGMSVLGSEYAELISSVPTDSGYEFKQIHNSQNAKNMIGASIGSGCSRSILCSHMSRNCSGSRCPCATVSSHFLERTDDDPLELFLRKNEAYLRENVQYPFMFVITQGSEALCISAYFAEDFRCQRLATGCYLIRDCSLYLAESDETIDSAQPVESLLPDALSGWQASPAEAPASARTVTAALKEKLAGYPHHSTIAADGITLLKNSSTGTLVVTKHLPLNAAATADTAAKDKPGSRKRKAPAGTATSTAPAAPKNPVNAYNFYSSEIRKTLGGANQPVRTNNEWNVEVGRMWRALGAAQRRPYQALAAQDRLRFAEECAAAGVSSTAKKSRTAYNFFVSEEKQFVTGTNVDNVKVKVGKHCSLRWKAMSDAERANYLVRAEHAAWQAALASAASTVPAAEAADTTEEEGETGSESEEE